MARKKGSFEKAELDGLSSAMKLFAHGLGKNQIISISKGEMGFNIRVGLIAEHFMRSKHDTKGRKLAIKRLVDLMDLAAQKNDGTELRWLADWVEQRKYSREHDPMRFELLIMKSPLGIDMPPPPPKTAGEIQTLIRDKYPPGEVPTLKNIHEAARELDVTLAKAKPGAPPGIPRKPMHRAKR